VNPILDVDQYPTETTGIVSNTVRWTEIYQVRFISNIYINRFCCMDDESCKLVTVNTHLGLFRYQLPFYIASMPAIFQHAMDMILQGIPHVIYYIDDVLVTGKTEEEHLQNLTQVLHRVKGQGMWLKEAKCAFFREKLNTLDIRLMLMASTQHLPSYRQFSKHLH